MGVALAAFFGSIVLIFVAFPIGIVATPLTAIWVIIAFCVKVLGWGFGSKSKSDD